VILAVLDPTQGATSPTNGATKPCFVEESTLYARSRYARRMGMTRTVPASGAPDLGALLAKLAGAGLPSAVLMIDQQLVAPGAPPPARWREARLKTPAGTVTLKLDGGAIAVTVFGNADPPLQAAQETIARLLSE